MSVARRQSVDATKPCSVLSAKGEGPSRAFYLLPTYFLLAILDTAFIS